MKNLLVPFSLFYSMFSFSQQAPGIEWQNTIGGSDEDYLTSILQTADGGYIVGGLSSSNISGDKTENTIGINGYFDYWVMKTDPSGTIQWQNTIGGDSLDQLHSVQQTSDGGFILGGYSASNISGDKTENSNGFGDYWIVKIDASGAIQWQNTIGGTGDDWLFAALQTFDGGYILGGYSSSDSSGDKSENNNGLTDYWIVKTDASGTIQWQNSIGGSSSDLLFSMQQTADSGYILSGSSWSNISGDKTENSIGGLSSDYWIVKTNASGTIQWQNTIGGNESDHLTSIQQATDGGFILGGFSSSGISGDKTENSIGAFSSDYWIVKTDTTGIIQWQNTIGGSSDDYLYSIRQTADGGYVLGGHSYSGISGDKTENNNGITDYWIMKTDPSGSIQWQNTIGGSYYDGLFSVQQTTDGGFILGGRSESNISGDKTENSNGAADYWIVKLLAETGLDEVGTNETFIISPNPFTTTATITINDAGVFDFILYNVYGREVMQLAVSSRQSTISRGNLAAGVYFYTVKDDARMIGSGKVVIE